MNTIKYSTIIGLGALLGLSAVSCQNQDNDFPDYEGGVSAYFAHQYPVKTITLGDDSEQDNTLDNKHQCVIYATQGGAYKSRDLSIDVQVDPSLVNDLTFSNGTPVKAMPSNYYSLESTTLTKKKDYLFGTTVTLTDAFFADKDALKETYVIPLRMIAARGADRILAGTPAEGVANPVSCNPADWAVAPKDYVLYGVKYINPWHSSYLRRGVDVVTDAAGTRTEVRHAEYVEKDEVVKLTTESLTECIFTVSTEISDAGGITTLYCDLKLTFNEGNVTVTTDTPGMTASGSGKFVKLGEKNSWDNKDRDALYLDYTVDFGGVKYATLDTLVMRTRDVAPIFDFNPSYTK